MREHSNCSREDLWLSQFELAPILTSPGGDSSQQDILYAFITLPVCSSPFLLPDGYAYRTKDDVIVITRDKDDYAPYQITIFGPNKGGQVNYLSEFMPNQFESFAYTRKIGRSTRKYPHAYPVGSGYDRGHRIDLHDTLAQSHNSNSAVINYTPQVSIYNQQIRRLLVDNIRQNGFGQYREIPLYSANPATLVQTFTGQSQQVEIPLGFIFQSYSDSQNKTYYFPNENGAYNKRQDQRYLSITPEFQIDNVSPYLLTQHVVVADDVKEIPYMSPSFHRALNLLSFTPAQLNHIGFETWRSNRLGGHFDIDGVAQSEPSLRWEGRAGVKDISLHRKAINNFFAFKLLQDAARYEFAAIDFRLTLVKILLEQFDHRKAATYWMKNIERFLKHTGSVDEILQAIEFAFDNHNIMGDAIPRLASILHHVISDNQRTTVEDEINAYIITATYQLPTTPLLFTAVNAITSSTVANHTVTRLSQIDQLKLMATRESLTEFSLERHHFIYNDFEQREWSSSYTEYHSPENYIAIILHNLSKNSPKLRVLNLASLKCNGGYSTDMLLCALSQLSDNAFPDLQLFDLSGNNFDNKAIGTLKKVLWACPNLETLDLNFNCLHNIAQLKEIATSQGTEISLDHQYIIEVAEMYYDESDDDSSQADSVTSDGDDFDDDSVKSDSGYGSFYF